MFMIAIILEFSSMLPIYKYLTYNNTYKILFILYCVFFFFGCSSTYRIADFSSKEKFYEDYNSFAKGKNVKITLLSGSSFYSQNTTQIINDTIFYYKDSALTKNYVLPTNEIEKIDYLSGDFKTAKLILKNGEQLNAENIFSLKDTMKFTGTKILKVIYALVPIDKVKYIYYKNNWPGIIPGVLIGTPLVGFLGSITRAIPAYEGDNISNTRTYDYAMAMVYGSAAGFIIGGVAGWLVGFNYTYIFNH